MVDVRWTKEKQTNQIERFSSSLNLWVDIWHNDRLDVLKLSVDSVTIELNAWLNCRLLLWFLSLIKCHSNDHRQFEHLSTSTKNLFLLSKNSFIITTRITFLRKKKKWKIDLILAFMKSNRILFELYKNNEIYCISVIIH